VLWHYSCPFIFCFAFYPQIIKLLVMKNTRLALVVLFVITDVKPGNYNLIIEAKAPYKNATREDILVTQGATTDVGEIKLGK